MSIVVVKKGMLTTVQDLGRVGFRRFGINPGGVMDRTAACTVNCLLGNEPDAALLELHFPAGVFRFERQCNFAIGGADFDATLDDLAVDIFTVYEARPGSVLRFRQRRSGNRAYLAVEGGFEADRWLDSASTNLRAAVGGHCGRRLQAGDCLEFGSGNASRSLIGTAIGPSLRPSFTSPGRIRVTTGPEFDVLTALSEQKLFDSTFEISRQSDRMGFRLSGDEIFRLDAGEMLSSGVTFGTVQLLPDGQMIVLMADHQTTGGYPRILTVASVDLPVLAQMTAGDRISFKLITIDEATREHCELERGFAFLRFGVRTRRAGNL